MREAIVRLMDAKIKQKDEYYISGVIKMMMQGGEDFVMKLVSSFYFIIYLVLRVSTTI